MVREGGSTSRRDCCESIFFPPCLAFSPALLSLSQSHNSTLFPLLLQRPYPIALAGIPISSTFIASTSSYKLRYAIPPAPLPGQPLGLTSKITEIFLPTRIYGRRFPLKEITVACSEGRIAFIDPVAQVLIHEGEERTNEWREGTIEIFVRKTQLRMNLERSGAAVGVALLAMFVWWFGYEEIMSWPEKVLLWLIALFFD